jgi:hypothetical protein
VTLLKTDTPEGKMTEAEKIRNLKGWPRWPWLPLKRARNHELELGVMYADDIDGPVRVFDINLFETSMRAAVALTNGAECPWSIHQTYENVDAMVADGWMGD